MWIELFRNWYHALSIVMASDSSCALRPNEAKMFYLINAQEAEFHGGHDYSS